MKKLHMSEIFLVIWWALKDPQKDADKCNFHQGGHKGRGDWWGGVEMMGVQRWLGLGKLSPQINRIWTRSLDLNWEEEGD